MDAWNSDSEGVVALSQGTATATGQRSAAFAFAGPMDGMGGVGAEVSKLRVVFQFYISPEFYENIVASYWHLRGKTHPKKTLNKRIITVLK